MGNLKIGITHGDINGVGYETILKAFAEEEMLSCCTPIIYGFFRLSNIIRIKPNHVIQLIFIFIYWKFFQYGTTMRQIQKNILHIVLKTRSDMMNPKKIIIYLIGFIFICFITRYILMMHTVREMLVLVVYSARWVAVQVIISVIVPFQPDALLLVNFVQQSEMV